MLDKYAFGVTHHHVEQNLLKLSDADTLKLVRFAHDMVSCDFGMDKMIVAALDMATKERAACEAERVVPAARLAQSLEHYLVTNFYDLTIDIGLVKCFCVPSVVEQLQSFFNMQTIGIERRRWKTEEPSLNCRTPAIFCLGGFCSDFAKGKKL